MNVITTGVGLAWDCNAALGFEDVGWMTGCLAAYEISMARVSES